MGPYLGFGGSLGGSHCWGPAWSPQHPPWEHTHRVSGVSRGGLTAPGSNAGNRWRDLTEKAASDTSGLSRIKPGLLGIGGRAGTLLSSPSRPTRAPRAWPGWAGPESGRLLPRGGGSESKTRLSADALTFGLLGRLAAIEPDPSTMEALPGFGTRPPKLKSLPPWWSRA